ncbi:hypothetical protein NCCP436_08870 [Pseudomonas sp. NCCP-436]|nr:hypothetical protein NCCP436_08870 [Pseudomonas sp. NCCP-436]
MTQPGGAGAADLDPVGFQWWFAALAQGAAQTLFVKQDKMALERAAEQALQSVHHVRPQC